jgi:translation elongation factor EF-Tu-like GTPase
MDMKQLALTVVTCITLINVLTLLKCMLSKTTYNIKAKISLLPTKMGGRKNPVATGYRPALAFNSIQHFSGEIELLDQQQIKPGESGTVLIKLIPAKHIRKNLKSNDAFTLNEGNKAVGSGIIISAEKIGTDT